MVRASTTSDVFNAIAEPRRREIVELLASGHRCDVSQLTTRLGIPQPAVSKHLSVLRKVGLVAVHKDGQRRLYSLNAENLKPVHDWVRGFERLWSDELAAIKQAAEEAARRLAQQNNNKSSI